MRWCRRRRWLSVLAALWLALAAALPAEADGIEVRKASLAAAQNGYELEAEFNIALTPTLEEALTARGGALPNCRLSTASLIVTLALVARSDVIAPISVEVARLLAGEGGLGVAFLPIDFTVEVKPYSLIRMRGQRLSRSAALVHDALIEARPGQRSRWTGEDRAEGREPGA